MTKQVSTSNFLMIETVDNMVRVGCADAVAMRSVCGIEAQKGQGALLSALCETTLLESDWQIEALDAIVVAVGPGNFTGIRIGVAFARGMALALGIPVIGVTAFDIMRAAMPLRVAESDNLVLASDGRGGRIYLWRGQHRDPWLGEMTNVGEADLPKSLRLAGFSSLAIAAELSKVGYQVEVLPFAGVMPMTALYVAAERYGHRPAKPYYLREADAALPRVGPPLLLD